jgi:hypothetical protein
MSDDLFDVTPDKFGECKPKLTKTRFLCVVSSDMSDATTNTFIECFVSLYTESGSLQDVPCACQGT